ncbi:MAG: hypothetical protein M3Y55_00480 [Pseudomonadota bacterium]|nr:hypothetical protein [Pseudomonadota bacterium]
MKLRRKYRILTALIALFGVLFTQLAMASYVCEGVSRGDDLHAITADASAMQPMPGCDHSGPTNHALCHAHCEDGKSSLDRPNAPLASPAMVIVFTILNPVEAHVSAPLPEDEPESLLLRTTSPPISIRHCCFRI